MPLPSQDLLHSIMGDCFIPGAVWRIMVPRGDVNSRLGVQGVGISIVPPEMSPTAAATTEESAPTNSCQKPYSAVTEYHAEYP
jgi:hypothetical protein